VGSSTRDFEIWLRRALGVECLSLWELCEGNPEGYVEKALEAGISFHRCPVLGNLEEGSYTGDFERWIKGALQMKRPSLGRGSEGSSFTGDPGRYVKKVSGCRHISTWGPLCSQGEPGMWGAHIPGTLMDE
jgi:hypothetical protein